MDSSQENEHKPPEPSEGEKNTPQEQTAPPASDPKIQAQGPAGFDRAKAQRRSGIGGAVFGVWIVAIGVLFLLQNLGLFEIGNIWRFWPLILIGLGISKIAGSYHPGGRVGGTFILVLGCVFLASNLGYVTRGVWNYIWPLALVFWGFMIIMGHSWRQRWFDRHGFDRHQFDRHQRRFDRLAYRHQNRWEKQYERAYRRGWGDPWEPQRGGTATANPDPNHPDASRPTDDLCESFSTGGLHASTSGVANRLHEYAILGGVRRRIDSQEFEGGDATAVMGGIELDLSSAGTKMEEVVIEANAFMGGINLRVPQNWDITVRGMGILGGYDDSTRQFAPSPGVKRPHLIITGQALFGGVQVRN